MVRFIKIKKNGKTKPAKGKDTWDKVQWKLGPNFQYSSPIEVTQDVFNISRNESCQLNRMLHS